MCLRRVYLVVMVAAVSICAIGAASVGSGAKTALCRDPPCEEQGTPGAHTSPRPQVTVGLKDIKRSEAVSGIPVEEGGKVAILSMDKKITSENRTFSWGTGPLPTQGKARHPDAEDHVPPGPASRGTPGPPATSLPLPIVTIASRLLYEDNQEDVKEKSRGGSTSSLASDPQPRDLVFDAVPDGEPYSTDTTHAQPTVLAWAGAFVSALQPSHFPLELVRAALERRITSGELIRESLRAEPGFIVSMCVGITLAVGVPLLGLVVCCCRLCGRCGSSKTQHHHDSCFQCQRRTLTVSLAAASFAVLLGVTVVVVCNERLAGAVGEARHSIQNNVRDLDTFLANTKMQLRHLLTNSLEQTVEAIYNDLDDIEYLLGRPLQRELAAEAQIEVALDSLVHISSGLRNIAGRMRSLEDSRTQAAARAEELGSRLSELATDLQRFVSRCSPEDADLCSSLDHRGLQLGVRFDSFSFTKQLQLLSTVEHDNLTETARRARLEYENIPSYVEVMTRQTRDEVKHEVRGFRGTLYSKVRGLDDMAFDLEVRTRDLTWHVDQTASSLLAHEHYRWYTGLGISLSLGFVWVLMTMGVCCGCCAHSEDQAPTERSCMSNSAGQTLISSVFFMFVVSGMLWTLVVAVFVVGAHAHAFICHPLYEEPTFPTLTRLLDHSGVVFKEGPMLTNILHPGQDVHLSIGHVLSQCKEGETAYVVFQLRHYFDVEREVDHRTTLDLRDTLGRLRVNLSQVEFLSQEAEVHLDDFLRSIKIDLGPYRTEMEKPLVQKNLPALVEQMQNVAGQLRSVSSAAELFKMVARTRTLITNILYPLEKRKEDVTYQVATLDMEAMPLQRQINQSIGHLRTIQYFIHNHGSSLAASKARGFVERILGYTRQYADHVRNSALHHVAPCTPVWNMFDSARGITCNGIIEPVNALWLATSWCLLLFLPSICVSLGLSRFYLRMDYDDDTLPLNNNGSLPGSTTNIQSSSTSAAIWSAKHSGSGAGHRHSYPSHQQNGHSHW
ncbi:prominin-1-A isoform X2 [Panulirus ornatus]|uniref:prominin-1-A isoform X2 n=1 Tax=Panulirus ornatus TaxID=150431 RepID=UPI003A837B83